MISYSQTTDTYYHNGEVITKEKYDNIKNIIQNRPTAPEGFEYRLTDALEWELVESPVIEEEDPELTEAEALNILLGGNTK